MQKLKQLKCVAIAFTLLLMSGCATTHNDPTDPFESYNRAMHSFNDTADRAVLKPAAQVYDAITPDPISQGISNLFSNLNDITVIINDLLQFKFNQAWRDTGRFLLNSTVGFAGIFDVASHAGIKKNNEDFGQTLGAWGVNSGPYVVLPFFGPRTVRDSFGMVGDMVTDPVTHIDHVSTRNEVVATKYINKRANLLGAKKVLGEAALDEYIFIRDAYLQRRQNLVNDGDSGDEEFDVLSDD